MRCSDRPSGASPVESPAHATRTAPPGGQGLAEAADAGNRRRPPLMKGFAEAAGRRSCGERHRPRGLLRNRLSQFLIASRMEDR